MDYLFRKQGWVTTKKVSEALGCSNKTVQQDLHIIQKFLPDTWKLERLKGKGVRLLIPDNESISSLKVLSYQDELFIKVIEKLMNHSFYTISSLSETLFLYPHSLYELLRKIEKDLSAFQLKLARRPLAIVGEEINLRLYLHHTYNQVYGESWGSEVYQEEYFQHFFQTFVDTMEIKFFPESLIKLGQVFQIAIKRMKQGHFISLKKEDIHYAKQTPFYEAVKKMAQDVQRRYGVVFTTSEKVYFSFAIMSSSFSWTKPLDNDLQQLKTEKVKGTYKRVWLFLQLLEESFDLSFHKDDEFLVALLQFFHKTTKFCTRTISVLPSNEQTICFIEEQYPQTVEKVQWCCEKWKEWNAISSVRKEEIMMLAMHIEATRKRMKQQKKKAFFMTVRNDGWGRYVESILAEHFGHKLMIIRRSFFDIKKDQIVGQADFIISDFPVDDKHLPVILISTLPTERDITKIQTYIEQKNSLL